MGWPTAYNEEIMINYTNKVTSLYKQFDPSNAFLNEKEMHKLILKNPKQFAHDFLGIDMLKYEHEPLLKSIKANRLKKAGWLNRRHQPKPDFIFYGTDDTIWIVECKNNIKQIYSEAFSQLLTYKYFNPFPVRKTKYLLLLSVFDYTSFEVFKLLKIPLKIALLNKTEKAIYG